MHLPHLLRDRNYFTSFVMGCVALALGIASLIWSTDYANVSASNSVTDIILSNTRVYDVEVLFVYGAMIAVSFSIILLFTIKPHALPFALKSTGLFLVIRSIFVSLTHMSPYPSRVVITDSFFSSYRLFQAMFTGDDLFFSGHVGLTFLMALIFWDTPVLRYIYLVLSVMFAVVVLLGHLHYSIDVFAAYFITYTIYTIARNAFYTDQARMA